MKTYENYTVTLLPEYIGIAQSMDDFFHPDDCLHGIIIRKGRMKHERFGNARIVMACTKMNESFNLCVMVKNPQNKWELSVKMCDGVFEDFVRQNYLD